MAITREEARAVLARPAHEVTYDDLDGILHAYGYECNFNGTVYWYRHKSLPGWPMRVSAQYDYMTVTEVELVTARRLCDRVEEIEFLNGEGGP